MKLIILYKWLSLKSQQKEDLAIEEVVEKEAEARKTTRPTFRSAVARRMLGSPGTCIEAVWEYISAVRNGDLESEFTAGQLIDEGLRKKDGQDLSVGTVRLELSRLEDIGVLESYMAGSSRRYMLSSDIRMLSPPQVANAIFAISNLPELNEYDFLRKLEGKEREERQGLVKEVVSNIIEQIEANFEVDLPRTNIVPVVTPLNNDGSISRRDIPKFMKYLAALGVTAILAMGATGEFFNLNNEQRLEALELYTKAGAEYNIKVYAGVSSDTEAETLNNIKKAERYGAAGVVIAPLYYLGNSEEIIHHFDKIDTNIPIILYNNPGLPDSAGNIEPWILDKLKGRFAGLKDSSGDMDLFKEYAKRAPVYQGDESALLESMDLGKEEGYDVRGFVGSMGNYSVLPLMLSKNLPRAQLEEMQEIISLNRTGLTGDLKKIPAAIKYMLSQIEVAGGPICSETVAEKTLPLEEKDRLLINALRDQVVNHDDPTGIPDIVSLKKIWRMKRAREGKRIKPRRVEPGKSKTVLVTGGAGYVGSHIVRGLLRAGYDVVVIDNFVRGRHFAVKRNEEYAGKIGRSYTFEEGDLADEEFLENVFVKHELDNKINYVMHFAAYTEVKESTEHPATYFDNNVVNTTHLSAAAKRHGVERFIFSSSAATYGEPTNVTEDNPITEEWPANPINPYGSDKLTMEEIIGYYGLEWVGLRYFNAAGASFDGDIGEAHTPESHLTPITINKLAQGQSMSVFGNDYDTRDGTCVRDYVSVEDLADAHIKALEMKKDHANRPYNLGTGKGITVLEIIKGVAKVLGVDPVWHAEPRRPGDPVALIASAEAFRNATGWIPKHSDKESIIETAVDWYMSRPDEATEEKPFPKLVQSVLVEHIITALEDSEIPREKQKELVERLFSDVTVASKVAEKHVDEPERPMIYADMSDTIALPPEGEDIFSAHEISLRLLVAKDISEENNERFEFIKRAGKGYRMFEKFRRDQNIAIEDRYNHWLEPFEGYLQQKHIDELVKGWRINEEFFEVIKLLREEMGLAKDEELEIEISSGNPININYAFMQREDVAARLAELNVEITYQGIELLMTNATYKGAISTRGTLFYADHNAYPENSIVIGDNPMMKYGFGSKYSPTCFVNAQDFHKGKAIAAIRAKLETNPEVMVEEQAIGMLTRDALNLVELRNNKDIADLIEGRYVIRIDNDLARKYEGTLKMTEQWRDGVKEAFGDSIKFTEEIIPCRGGKNRAIEIVKLDNWGRPISISAIRLTGSEEMGPRLFGLLNMAFAGCNIPNTVNGEGLADYEPLINFINKQYYDLTEIANYIHFNGDPDEALRRIRNITIDLPPIERVESYNRASDLQAAIETLTSV